MSELQALRQLVDAQKDHIDSLRNVITVQSKMVENLKRQNCLQDALIVEMTLELQSHGLG